MRTIRVSAFGGPEVLELVDSDVPKAARSEVIVRVSAAGVNFLDILQRGGAGALRLPFTPGLEGAGEIVAVGAEVDNRRVGDRVGWVMVPGAGYSEYVAVPSARCVSVPADLDLVDVAAVLMQGITAQFLTESTFPVGGEHTVVVQAASGGVGSLVTRLAVKKGARVIGFGSNDEKLARITELGAIALPYDGPESAQRVRDLSEGDGAHVVFDGVGQATFEVGLDALRRFGYFVLYGASSGAVPPVDPQALNRGGSLYLTRPGLAHHIAREAELRAHADRLFDLMRAGWIVPGQVTRLTLDDAPLAHRNLAERKLVGKQVLVMGT